MSTRLVHPGASSGHMHAPRGAAFLRCTAQKFLCLDKFSRFVSCPIGFCPAILWGCLELQIYHIGTRMTLLPTMLTVPIRITHSKSIYWASEPQNFHSIFNLVLLHFFSLFFPKGRNSLLCSTISFHDTLQPCKKWSTQLTEIPHPSRRVASNPLAVGIWREDTVWAQFWTFGPWWLGQCSTLTVGTREDKHGVRVHIQQSFPQYVVVQLRYRVWLCRLIYLASMDCLKVRSRYPFFDLF